MPVVDANAIIAFLIDEPARPHVSELLYHPTRIVHINAVNLAEIVDVLGRQTGDLRLVEEQVDLLLTGGLEVVAADETIGRWAGVLRARHYDRRIRAVSLADCVALATSARLDEPFVTSDRALSLVAEAEGIEVIRIPDSTGRIS